MLEVKVDGLVKSQSARHCEESAFGGRRGNLRKSMNYKQLDCCVLLAMTSFMIFYQFIKMENSKITG